jgi:hypothetical protein
LNFAIRDDLRERDVRMIHTTPQNFASIRGTNKSI